MATFCQLPESVGGGRYDVTGNDAAQKECVRDGGTLVPGDGCSASVGGPATFPGGAAFAVIAMTMIWAGLRARGQARPRKIL